MKPLRIVLYSNPSNFASSLLPALRSLGHEVELFSSWIGPSDRAGFQIKSYNDFNGFWSMAAYYARWRLQRRKKRDFILNYSGNAPNLFNGPSVPYFQGGDIDQNPFKEPAYYCTGDMKRLMPEGSILLPRAVDVDRFTDRQRSRERFHFAGIYPELCWCKHPRQNHKGLGPVQCGDCEDPDTIRIGHFWRRDTGKSAVDWAMSYANRYWKKSDLLYAAIKLLRDQGYSVSLNEGRVPRTEVSQVLANLDVFVDEFCNLSHSATAVESLLSGTPVIGSYCREMCECREAYNLLLDVTPTPEVIAASILRAREIRIDPEDSEPVRDFYNPLRTASILMDTYERFL